MVRQASGDGYTSVSVPVRQVLREGGKAQKQKQANAQNGFHNFFSPKWKSPADPGLFTVKIVGSL
jgi:hypothetical protein